MRNLEPWRAILAVARWLDSQDVDGKLMQVAERGIAGAEVVDGDSDIVISQPRKRFCG